MYCALQMHRDVSHYRFPVERYKKQYSISQLSAALNFIFAAQPGKTVFNLKKGEDYFSKILPANCTLFKQDVYFTTFNIHISILDMIYIEYKNKIQVKNNWLISHTISVILLNEFQHGLTYFEVFSLVVLSNIYA